MASVIHHRFTVQEYDQMIAAGIVAEDDAVELIQGEIVRKMPVGRLHGAAVKRLNQLLTTRLQGTAIVSVQDPIVLAASEPEPDLALLAPRKDFYASAKPTADDVRLVIEVADSSLAYDREIKLPLYAQAAIQEFWIVNLDESLVEVYRQPQPTGCYASRQDYARGDLLNMLAFPEIILTVAETLG